jgi:16S rRNA (cytidine1402-2'-O)-methyltransferase
MSKSMSYQIAIPTGKLYIVATPIGNLDDMSFRAISTLKDVNLILAEDTRHANILLQHFQISTSCESFHAHNEQKKTERYINMLQKGIQIALISDAGTPLISDPGYPLVQQARQLGIHVTPIPGPSAIICALSAAGLPTDNFSFHGFPPAKASARIQFFKALKYRQETVVFYESTHRILDCLDDAQTVYGENQHMVLAKELTKSYEHFESATISDVMAWLKADLHRCKGEFVCIFPPQPPQETDDSETLRILKILLEELSTKQAISIAQKMTGVNKNKIYNMAIKLQNT